MPRELSLLYNSHNSRYRDDIPFWRALADRQGRFALELGCGAGRVLLALSAAGIEMVGLDRDLEMLEILHLASLADELNRVFIFQADMAQFSLGRRFPFILIPCNTLSALPDEKRPPTFQRIAAHLESGGIFAASLPNPAQLEQLPPEGDPEIEDHFLHPETGNPVQVSSAWTKLGDRIEFRWHYDHLLPDGSVERSTAPVSHSLASLDQYKDELAQAGLELVEIFGDYESHPYTAESPNLLLNCAVIR